MTVSNMDSAIGDHAHNKPDEKLVPVTFNRQAILLPKSEMTGLEIKTTAIEQGIPIDVGFQLWIEHGNGNDIQIGDDDPVKVHPKMVFTAIAPDDNS
jgi:Multiubiquitin